MTRAAFGLWLLLAVLWTLQAWRPQLSYPRQGMLFVAGLAALLLAALRLDLFSRRSAGAEPPTSRWTLRLGFLFFAYVTVRWAAEGFPAVGSDTYGTLAGCAGWALAAGLILASIRRLGPNVSQALTSFYLLLSALALACGLHALLQFHVLYDRALADLLLEIGSAEPTPLQQGLIHHLKIKRVASIWGDPNTLAGFSALSLAPSVFLLHQWSLRRTGAASAALVATFSVPAALTAIWLADSRGGKLDTLLAAVLLLLLLRRVPAPLPGQPDSSRSFLALLAITVVVVFNIVLSERAQAASVAPRSGVESSSSPAWFSRLSRLDTIRERLHYAHVGVAICREFPLFGAGPGGVDLHFGRYKPLEAREAKYLHNWPIQTAAEFGLTGLAMALLFTAALLSPARWRLVRAHPHFVPAFIMALVFLFDALIQLSFNQRELMALFGICVGILAHASAPAEPGSAEPRSPLPAVVATLLIAGALLALVLPALAGLAHRQAADDAWDDGDAREAVRQLRLASQWAPRDPTPLLRLGLIEAERSGPATGARFVEQALRLQPQSAALHAHLGRLRLQAGAVDDAERLTRQALALYPSNADHLDLLSRIEERKGRLPEALVHARLALQAGFRTPEKHAARVRELEAKLPR